MKHPFESSSLSSPSRARRKALLVGISYHEQARLNPDSCQRLSGANEDPKLLMGLLTEKYQFKQENITILTDGEERVDRLRLPTKFNMIKHMKMLVQDVKPGDHLVFLYSGHGSQVNNYNNTEDDGLDEILMPVNCGGYDFANKSGEFLADPFIKDNDLKRILVDNLPDGAHLTAILDCCHSGTALDLPHHYVLNSRENLLAQPTSLPFTSLSTKGLSRSLRSRRIIFRSTICVPPTRKAARSPRKRIRTLTMGVLYIERANLQKDPKNSLKLQLGINRILTEEPHQLFDEPLEINPDGKPSTAHVTSWSACLDDQQELDTSNGGLLTTAIVKLLRENPDRTYRELLQSISKRNHTRVKNMKKRLGYDILPPDPCIGSLQPLNTILDKKFTF